MVDYVEQVDDAQLAAFAQQVQAKCQVCSCISRKLNLVNHQFNNQKYRNAVAKDKAKQQTLLNDLEKDFGDRINVLKSIQERKEEIGSSGSEASDETTTE